MKSTHLKIASLLATALLFVPAVALAGGAVTTTTPASPQQYGVPIYWVTINGVCYYDDNNILIQCDPATYGGGDFDADAWGSGVMAQTRSQLKGDMSGSFWQSGNGWGLAGPLGNIFYTGSVYVPFGNVSGSGSPSNIWLNNLGGIGAFTDPTSDRICQVYAQKYSAFYGGPAVLTSRSDYGPKAWSTPGDNLLDIYTGPANGGGSWSEINGAQDNHNNAHFGNPLDPPGFNTTGSTVHGWHIGALACFAQAPPEIVFTASAYSVNAGDPVLLTWNKGPNFLSDGTSCSSTGGWNPPSLLGGTKTINPVTNQVLTYSCTNSWGTKTITLTIDVNAAKPQVSCAPSPSTTNISTNMTWQATASGGTGSYTTFNWTGSSVGSTGSTPSKTVQYANAGTYTESVEVVDSNNVHSDVTACSSALTVNGSGNIAPTANAGSDKAITLPTQQVAVNNASASDPDGPAPLTYLWTQIGGPISAGITNGTTPAPTFTGLTTAGTYSFRLTATDGAGASGSDDMQVVVSPAAAALSVTCSGSPPSPSTGQTVTWRAFPSGGSGNYVSFTWTVAPGGSGNPWLTSYNGAGVKSQKVTVTDSVGATATSLACTVNVSAPNTRPLAFTDPPTLITTTSATLNGEVWPTSNLDAVGWFRYSSSNPGNCTDTFGTRVPAAGSHDLGTSPGYQKYSDPISGLTSGVTYYYCAIAQNSVGLSYGSVVTFVPSVLPDLTAGGVGVAGGTAKVGTPAQFLTTITNIGASSTGKAFKNVLKIKNTADPLDVTGLRFIAVNSAGPLKGNGGQTAAGYSISYTPVATDLPPAGSGYKYFSICANQDISGNWDAITESQYTNNCSGWSGIWIDPPTPDLIASNFTAIPASAAVNDPVDLGAAITNQGVDLAGASTAIFELVPNESFYDSSAYKFVTAPTGALSSGGSQNVSAQYKFPAPGIWNVRVCADLSSLSDQYGVVDEGPNHSGEWNNCDVGSAQWQWHQIVINPPPPTCSVVVSPVNVLQGKSATVTWSCQNVVWGSCQSVNNLDGFDVDGAQSGIQIVFPKEPPFQLTSYAVQCSGSDNSGQKSFPSNQFQVVTALANISANPPTVALNGTSQITASCNGVKNGKVTGPGVPFFCDDDTPVSKVADGSHNYSCEFPSTPITDPTTYTVSCDTISGPSPVTASVTVIVRPDIHFHPF